MLNEYGYFEYGPMSAEILRLKKEVEEMSDYDLINEVSDQGFLCEDLDDIIIKFTFTNEELTEEERGKLIGLYILLHCEEDLEIDNEEK